MSESVIPGWLVLAGMAPAAVRRGVPRPEQPDRLPWRVVVRGGHLPGRTAEQQLCVARAALGHLGKARGPAAVRGR